MDKKSDFIKSDAGRIVITIISCVVIWGITLAIWTSGSSAGVVVMLICAVFGWQALNKITPALFVWMPLIGWVVYFVIKFILSALIGLFVAPFVIGKKVGGAAHESIRKMPKSTDGKNSFADYSRTRRKPKQ